MILKRDHAALGVLQLLFDHAPRDVNRVADKHRRDETQFVDAVKRDDRFLVGGHLHHQSGGDAEDQRAVGDAPAERSAFGVLLVHVQLDEIAGEAGEIHDVGFGDGAAARRRDARRRRSLRSTKSSS